MNVLSDDSRAELLESATELLDCENVHRAIMRSGLELAGTPAEVIDAAITLLDNARDMAFQRGRAICMLENADALDAGFKRAERKDDGPCS